ncbi:Dihydroneopterin aldolase [invertebrate metagenome]|uniref:dihydroneopterin aldolase n=1 Tax=invertebrate metagenome TaxID=1711999 RepID=A0A2H9T648_9ZZZZ
MHSDKVCIDNLAVQTVIGVYEYEKTKKQPLLIDLELTTNFSSAFVSDQLQDALDYDAISQHIRKFCEVSHFQLIEALAGAVIQQVFSISDASHIAVRIRKPEALNKASASIWCERNREQM